MDGAISIPLCGTEVVRESFWRDLYGQTKRAWKEFLEERSRKARARDRSFRPPGLERFQRRAAEVTLLIREAFLRGISTRQVGRVVAILTEEVVSAQTVSKLCRHLDRLVKAFQQVPLQDEWASLFLDGVSLRVQRSRPFTRRSSISAAGCIRCGISWRRCASGTMTR